MQQTTIRTKQDQRWTHGMALERKLGLPNSLLLSDTAIRKSVVERLLSATRLESSTLNQLARILTVTVQDWGRK
jgi:hypothetical protein